MSRVRWKEGDYRQDVIVKSEILDKLLAAGNQIAYVIKDCPSVVAMWRTRPDLPPVPRVARAHPLRDEREPDSHGRARRRREELLAQE